MILLESFKVMCHVLPAHPTQIAGFGIWDSFYFLFFWGGGAEGDGES